MGAPPNGSSSGLYLKIAAPWTLANTTTFHATVLGDDDKHKSKFDSNKQFPFPRRITQAMLAGQVQGTLPFVFRPALYSPLTPFKRPNRKSHSISGRWISIAFSISTSKTMNLSPPYL